MSIFRFPFPIKKAGAVWWTLYFGIALINLDKLPIVWIDEVQLADVGRNLSETGRMFSKVWGLPGTETVFLAYPPFVIFYQAFWQFVLPNGVFWVRLPFLLAFPISLFFLHKILNKHYKLNPTITLLLLIFFSIDRGVYESLRSYRVEVLELALLSVALYYFLIGKKSVLVALLCSLLAICHLSLLPLALLLWLFNFVKNPSWKSIAIAILPPFFWLGINGFNIHELYNQMFALGSEHSANGNVFYNHFIGRFFPYYNAQPLVPVLFWLMHLWCIYSLWRKKNIQSAALEILFLTSSVYWLSILGPYYRYNTPLILLMLVILGEALSRNTYLNISRKAWLPAIYLILPLVAWGLRNGVALAERPQRDINKVYQWLDSINNDKTKKLLIIGQPAAWYYSIRHENVEYTSIYAVRHFHFDSFARVFYIPDEGREYAGTLSSTLEIAPFVQLPEAFKGITYNGSKIYRIETFEEMKRVQAQYPW